MKRKRHTPDEIIRKLREAEARLGSGSKVADLCQKHSGSGCDVTGRIGELASRGQDSDRGPGNLSDPFTRRRSVKGRHHDRNAH